MACCMDFVVMGTLGPLMVRVMSPYCFASNSSRSFLANCVFSSDSRRALSSLMRNCSSRAGLYSFHRAAYASRRNAAHRSAQAEAVTFRKLRHYRQPVLDRGNGQRSPWAMSDTSKPWNSNHRTGDWRAHARS